MNLRAQSQYLNLVLISLLRRTFSGCIGVVFSTNFCKFFLRILCHYRSTRCQNPPKFAWVVHYYRNLHRKIRRNLKEPSAVFKEFVDSCFALYIDLSLIKSYKINFFVLFFIFIVIVMQ